MRDDLLQILLEGNEDVLKIGKRAGLKKAPMPREHLLLHEQLILRLP